MKSDCRNMTDTAEVINGGTESGGADRFQPVLLAVPLAHGHGISQTVSS